MDFNSVKPKEVVKGPVYCPICTRTVEAEIVLLHKRPAAKTGQHCGHCAASLDAAFVLQYDRAA